MKKDFGKLTTPIYTTGKTNAKVRKLNGFTMFTILFSLFILILGVTAGLTYSGFQSTAESNGTLTFAVNGHQGTMNLSNTKVSSYNSQDLTLTFILASDTNYTSPTISGITMGGVALTQSSGDFKTSTNAIVATYSAPTLTINRANVSGDLVITGSSTAQTYTITYNSNGGTGSMANTVVNYGSNANLRANSFSRSGYTFEGWSTTSGGSVELCDCSIIKDLGNTILYAIWELDYITITVTDTTAYYNISGSLYSRGNAYYKCSTCNDYSTSSTGTGCYHNYSTAYYYCPACDTYSSTSREATVCSSRSHSYASGTYWYCTYESKYVTSSTCYHTPSYYHSCSTTQTCGACNGTGQGQYHPAYNDVCSYCGGTGYGAYHPSPCGNCGGDGIVGYEWDLSGIDIPIYCNVCGGTGTYGGYYDECVPCNGTGFGAYHDAYYDPCGTCNGSGSVTCTTCNGNGYYYTYGSSTNYATTAYYCSVCGSKSTSSSGTGCYHQNDIRYKCSYCNGYSTTSGPSGSCSSHNHSYNTSTLYYDYTRVYGSGSSTVSKSSASYSTGYYWHATYGALTLNSTLSYTDGYTYRVIQVMNSTTLKIKRET